jgi:tRNA1Val (adenine37-N6)-methyltransferase
MENVSASPWQERVRIHPASLQQFGSNAGMQGKFDVIVCNPPFHDDSSPSPEGRRRIARHSEQLSLADLCAQARSLLTNSGWLSLIVPFERKGECCHLARQNGLLPLRITAITAFSGQRPKRVLVEFGREAMLLRQSQIAIYQARDRYSAEYWELTRTFYLEATCFRP